MTFSHVKTRTGTFSEQPSEQPSEERPASPSAKPVVLIYSGGLDSYTTLHKAIKAGHEVFALSFNYGQKQKKELDVAKRVCESLSLSHKISHKIIDITQISSLLSSSCLVDAQATIPEGGHTDASMSSTLVPNRNMILLSLAIAYAMSKEITEVWYGAHSGDYAIYPDCRPEFVERMNQVSAIAGYQAIDIVAPYLYLDKSQIVAEGLAMGLDYGQTWTCYVGGEKACGRCGACTERLDAFALNGQTDPLSYDH